MLSLLSKRISKQRDFSLMHDMNKSEQVFGSSNLFQSVYRLFL